MGSYIKLDYNKVIWVAMQTRLQYSYIGSYAN